MDKEWMSYDRNTNEYKAGVREFILFARGNALKTGEDLDNILCPCKQCKNLRHQSCETVWDHLIIKGMDMTYDTFVCHGEKPNKVIPNFEMSETYNLCRAAYMENERKSVIDDDQTNDEFKNYMENVESPLYLGCTTYTRLSAAVVLYKLKAISGWSNKSFNRLLDILCEMLPNNNTLPDSLYSVKRLLKEFDLEERKIHACVNDCVLFRGDLELANTCPKCESSRWKVDDRTDKVYKKVPKKVLRYFPIIPRFKRMFGSVEKAELLRWHFNNKSKDGYMHHPVDSFAWDKINKNWLSFSNDPRNLRLALAADGMNPYRGLSSKYSIWPVMLVIYNLPPWLCMKKEYMMLALLIPGDKQPGDEIDVYLQPLIDDLLELWNKGVQVYDAFTKSFFSLKAVLMWTISDFPALGNLAGCTVKGKKACPVCANETHSCWLPFSKKFAYMGSRKFLPSNHPYRQKKSWFNGKKELGEKPSILAGTKVFAEVENIQNDFGKVRIGMKRKKKCGRMWKKRSIFFDLPYWEHLVLLHNLDVMHMEKNVCESIVGTLLNVKEKSKDGLHSRQDLQVMGIRCALHPKDNGKRTFLPAAPHTLSKKDKNIMLKRLTDLKLPDGYSSNIGKRCVKMVEGKIIGLKSHDCHVLMQQLLPVSLRGLLPRGSRDAIFRFCAFFNKLCQRVIHREEMEALEDEVAETLCMLERFFPPSFFDIMVHLTIHLAREARVGGPVHLRWMFAFERYMKMLKGYVRNPARPEGCIAENYVANEAMRFCSEHMKKVAEMDVRESRHEEYNETILEGRPTSKERPVSLTDEMLESAHRYVLFNMAVVEPYVKLHIDELKHLEPRLSKNESLLWARHVASFSSWLRQKVTDEEKKTKISNLLKWLAYGPRNQAMSCSCYIIKGQRFHTKEGEKSTQDSGVCINSKTLCRSSSKDANQVFETVSYYGYIKDIILLDYHTFRIPVFNCYWANVTSGVKVDDGFTLVNLHQGQSQQKEPFILASQANKVFYSRESDLSAWYVLLKVPPKGFIELVMHENIVDIFPQAQDVSSRNWNVNNDDDETYVRKDCEGVWV